MSWSMILNLNSKVLGHLPACNKLLKRPCTSCPKMSGRTGPPYPGPFEALFEDVPNSCCNCDLCICDELSGDFPQCPEPLKHAKKGMSRAMDM